MALAGAVQGATRPAQIVTWTQDDGSEMDLTDATMTGRILNKATQEARDITGTLTPTDAAHGIFTWAYSAADVEEAGVFLVQFTATFAESPTPARTYRQEWTVESAI